MREDELYLIQHQTIQVNNAVHVAPVKIYAYRPLHRAVVTINNCEYQQYRSPQGMLSRAPPSGR